MWWRVVHWPSQVQSRVQLSPVFTQRHLVQFSLHLQAISSCSLSIVISAFADQTGSYISPIFFQPHSQGSGDTDSRVRQLVHTKHCSIALLRWLKRASLVGGMLSIGLFSWLNRIRLASLTVSAELEAWYINTTKRWRIRKLSLFCERCWDMVEYSWKAVSTSLKDIHVFQAVIFPIPPKLETVSAPVNAWKKGSRFETPHGMSACISWTGKYCKCLPVPYSTYNCTTLLILGKAYSAITTTSESTVFMMTFECPSMVLACQAWSRRRASASSWKVGDIEVKLVVLSQSIAVFLYVHTIFFPLLTFMFTRFFAKNPNSCSLLSSCAKILRTIQIPNFCKECYITVFVVLSF